EGISAVSPGASVSGASRQARRSMPAEPSVAYCGSGNSRPRRASRMRTSRRRRCAGGSTGGMSGRAHGRDDGAAGTAGLALALTIARGDDFHELMGQRGLAGALELLLAARPVDGERVLVHVEGKIVADPVGGDQIEVLGRQLHQGVALDVL